MISGEHCYPPAVLGNRGLVSECLIVQTWCRDDANLDDGVCQLSAGHAA